MQQSIVQEMARQLAVQAPMLLALIVMMSLALTFWRRHPSACMGAFLGALLLFMTSVVQAYVGTVVLRRATPGRATIGETLMVLAIVANLFRAAGIGLLTWAVFTGRRRPAASGFPMSVPPPLSGGAGAGPGTR
jgi:hypothetical protein